MALRIGSLLFIVGLIGHTSASTWYDCCQMSPKKYLMPDGGSNGAGSDCDTGTCTAASGGMSQSNIDTSCSIYSQCGGGGGGGSGGGGDSNSTGNTGAATKATVMIAWPLAAAVAMILPSAFC